MKTSILNGLTVITPDAGYRLTLAGEEIELQDRFISTRIILAPMDSVDNYIEIPINEALDILELLKELVNQAE